MSTSEDATVEGIISQITALSLKESPKAAAAVPKLRKALFQVIAAAPLFQKEASHDLFSNAGFLH